MAEQEPQQPVDLVEVSGEPLDLLRYTRWVSDPGAGAISTFSGVTRNSFQGKAVLRLEYEAYVPMALKELKVRAPACLGGLTVPGGVDGGMCAACCAAHVPAAHQPKWPYGVSPRPCTCTCPAACGVTAAAQRGV